MSICAYPLDPRENEDVLNESNFGTTNRKKENISCSDNFDMMVLDL